jgi:hypothetical protein
VLEGGRGKAEADTAGEGGMLTSFTEGELGAFPLTACAMLVARAVAYVALPLTGVHSSPCEKNCDEATLLPEVALAFQTLTGVEVSALTLDHVEAGSSCREVLDTVAEARSANAYS